MNRGRGRSPGGYSSYGGRQSSRSGGRSTQRHAFNGATGSSNNYPGGSKDGNFHSGRQKQQEWKPRGTMSRNSEGEPLPGGKDRSPSIGNLQQGQNTLEAVGSSSKQLECSFPSDSTHEKDFDSLSAQSSVETPGEDAGNDKTLHCDRLGKVNSGCMHDDSQLPSKSGINERPSQNNEPQVGQPSQKRIQIVETPGEDEGNDKTLHCDQLGKVNSGCMHDDSQLPSKSGINERPSQNNEPQVGQPSPGDMVGNRNSVQSEHSVVDDPFDICQKRTGTPVLLKPSLFENNREKRNELKRSVEGQKNRKLRRGMVLLNRFLSITDQVKIVKICRECGLAPGGFYQPGYRDGAKLHLKMMCLGKNWDPESSKYVELRPHDDARPQVMPDEFNRMVKKAIQEAHDLIGEDVKASNVEEILPWMSPNICIVNFYSASGRLGLHQDKDESVDSLYRGLPVVSFSIGDTAEFLYSDQRDADKAEKIELVSGDVLIFGGKSRHIFHGVSAIRPNTAPKSLLEQSNLRPGRLNLTFRQY